MITPSKSPAMHRAQGVTVSRSQTINPEETGEPGTLKAMADIEWKAVWYYGQDGKLVANVVALIGGKVFFAPDGEQWARRLSPAKEPFAKQVFARLKEREKTTQSTAAAADEALPGDTVDVTGAEANDGPSGK